MRTTYEDGDVLVLDDVLPPEPLEALWHAVRNAAYEPAHTGTPGSPWRPTDGQPLRAVQNAAAWVADPPTGSALGRTLVHPTGSPLDPVLDVVLAARDRLTPWVGEAGEDWRVVSACPFMYPQGAALSLHTDAGNQQHTGAYTFYVHPTWSVEWGGELLVYPGNAAAEEVYETTRSPRFRPGAWDEILDHPDGGRFFVPKRNRMVVVRGGTPHKVARVDPSAGYNMRASVNGFFLSHV